LIQEFGATQGNGSLSPVAIYTYNFDPNGNTVDRVDDYPNQSGYRAELDLPSVYDAYGELVWKPDVFIPGDGFPDYYFGSIPEPLVHRYKGQYGYVTDTESNLIYCQNRFYDPYTARWVTRDPSGLDGGINTYQYCLGDPIDNNDPTGYQTAVQTFLDDWTWSEYVGDAWAVVRGEGSSLNPINWGKGLWGLGGYLWDNGITIDSAKHIGSQALEGINIFDKDDPYAFGQSMMNLELTVAPLVKRIPNFTRFKLVGPYDDLKSFTVVSYENSIVGPDADFRVDFGEIPNKNNDVRWARGKRLPHYHGRRPRPGGGIRNHRPWQNGW
jgi:RHS repeat-associated protein